MNAKASGGGGVGFLGEKVIFVYDNVAYFMNDILDSDFTAGLLRTYTFARFITFIFNASLATKFTSQFWMEAERRERGAIYEANQAFMR